MILDRVAHEAARAHHPHRRQRGRGVGGRPPHPACLLPFAQNDPEAQSHLSAFTQELARLGWSQDRNIRIDARFAAGMADQYPVFANELAALEPDVILSES